MNKHFVALVTSDWFTKGAKFVPVTEEENPTLFNGAGRALFYVWEDHPSPILHVAAMEDSNDFKEVEELWMPTAEDPAYRIHVNRIITMFLMTDKQLEEPFFSTEADCQNAIEQSNALVKELSDKSRGKGGDDGE